MICKKNMKKIVVTDVRCAKCKVKLVESESKLIFIHHHPVIVCGKHYNYWHRTHKYRFDYKMLEEEFIQWVTK
jgi:hypothetical protein